VFAERSLLNDLATPPHAKTLGDDVQGPMHDAGSGGRQPLSDAKIGIPAELAHEVDQKLLADRNAQAALGVDANGDYVTASST